MMFLQMSISGSMIILLVLGIRILALHKLPKKLFPVLWGIAALRLLIPFSLPSFFQIPSLGLLRPSAAGSSKASPLTPLASALAEKPSEVSPAPVWSPEAAVSLWTAIWLTGFILCLLFFVWIYWKSWRDFQTSFPIENTFTISWLNAHPTRRPISIKQSHRISTPLTFGVLHPVILMPGNTSWDDETALQYIFAHELVHIKRFDLVWKLLLTAILCLHWWNPLVFLMYILANRDLELSCDEQVIRQFGRQIRADYAEMLIRMEETRGGLAPFCSSFSKNVMEERIESIMKIKFSYSRSLMFLICLFFCSSSLLIFSACGSSTKVAVPNTADGAATAPAQASEPLTAEAEGISYDLAEVRHYRDGGKPYVFWAQSNHTGQAIREIQFAMLAFDADGHPLSLPWDVTDSSAGYSYQKLYVWEPADFAPGDQADSAEGYEEGGWSLGWTIDFFNQDTPELQALFSQVAYILCCDKQVTFENGQIWDNPEYESWLESYEGKEVEVSVLENYYPYVEKVMQ